MQIDHFSDIIYARDMGRKTINEEQTPARFPAGTLARVDSLLAPKEKRADFIRDAVDAEIRKRERRGREPVALAAQAPAE